MKSIPITIKGVTRSAAAWSKQPGAVPLSTIYFRLRAGSKPAEAVFGPNRRGVRYPQLRNHMGDPCIVCSAREKGMSYQEIAEAIGTSATPVREHVRHIKTPQQRAREAAVALIAAGVPYREITRRTGIFPSALAAMNRRLGLSVRKIGRPTVQEQERAA